MSATRATRPAFCPFIYHDGESLYLEFDAQVIRFPYTEGGLHKALKHIPNVTKQQGFLSGGRNIIANKVLAKGHIARISPATQRKRTITNVSDSVRSAASALIRKKLGAGSA